MNVVFRCFLFLLQEYKSCIQGHTDVRPGVCDAWSPACFLYQCRLACSNTASPDSQIKHGLCHAGLCLGPGRGALMIAIKKKEKQKETNANDYLGGSLLVRNLSLSLWLSGWIAAIVCGHAASGKINTDWAAAAVQQHRNNNNTIICYGCRGERAALSTNGGLPLAVQVRQHDVHMSRTRARQCWSSSVSQSHSDGELCVNSYFNNHCYSETNWWMQDSKMFVVLCTQQWSHF